MPISSELVDLIAARAAAEGCNGSPWPGLVFWRFDGPVRAHDEVVASCSLHVIAQGRARVEIDGRSAACGPSGFLVLAQGARFACDVTEASRARPLLAARLRVDPVLTIELIGELDRCAEGSPPHPEPKGERRGASPAPDGLAGALARFVAATDAEPDRRVLAPLALREVAYRVLRSGQGAELAAAARRENSGDRVAAAVAFMRDELHRPITVEDMAKHVSTPLSTFAHLFKAATGSAPYQYLKRLRLDRARALLVEENRAVGDACRAVGYGSVSHFIVEFKRAYGETPRAHASRVRRSGPASSPEAER